MDFGAALKAMKERKKVRRASWPAGTYSIHGTKEQYGYDTFIVHCVKDGSFSDERFTFLNEDIFAEDWKIVEGIPEVQFHSKEYFTYPNCEHENYSFHLDNGNSKCEICGKVVKTVPCEKTRVETVLWEYRKYLATKISEFDQEARKYLEDDKWSKAGQCRSTKRTYLNCLEVLNQIESGSK